MWQTVGHDTAVLALSRAIEQGRMHHALLLIGPPRVGKMALAMDMARALSCVGDEPPCDECSQCARITASLHPDVRVIGLGEDERGRARTLISIEQVREVQKEASLKPYEGAFRVFIIDGVDRLSDEAANSLLKTLEEPPDQVVLALLASDASAVLTTIRSRCRRLDLRPVSVDTIEDHLVRALGVESELAQEVARLSNGRIGWAIQAARQPELLERLADRLDVIERTVMSGLEPRFEYAAQLAGRFAQSRADVLDELGLWLGWWRDVMIVCEGRPELVWHTSRRPMLESVASGLDAAQSAVTVKAVERVVSLLERNVNPRLAVEELMLAMPHPVVPADSLSAERQP